MIDSVNFHSFFPGGLRRELVEKRKSPSAEWGYIVRDLDTLLSGFDSSDLIQERRLGYQKMHKVHQMVNKNPLILPEEVEHLELEYGNHFQRVQEIVHPFYEKMLQLGYSRADLII